MNPYPDLEIRIQAKTDHGYPIEMTLDGHQRFHGGYFHNEIIPWIPSSTAEDEGQRLFQTLFADNVLSRAWERFRSQQPQRRIRLNIAEAAL